jgi:hypothetical protein
MFLTFITNFMQPAVIVLLVIAIKMEDKCRVHVAVIFYFPYCYSVVPKFWQCLKWLTICSHVLVTSLMTNMLNHIFLWFQTAASTKYCTLGTLSEGCIGKLQLLKSGRARLVLGNTVLHVDMGTQVGFREVSTEVIFKEKLLHFYDVIALSFCYSITRDQISSVLSCGSPVTSPLWPVLIQNYFWNSESFKTFSSVKQQE